MKYLTVISLSLLIGCASSYKPLLPSTLNYQNQTPAKEKLEISYLYDIQNQTRNKRYARKENKFGYAAIGLRIKNTTNQTVTLTQENFKINANGVTKKFVSVEDYTKVVRQTSAPYLLHSLWGPWSISHVEDPSQGINETTVQFIPVGVAVGIGNLIVAESANKRHLETLMLNQIYGKSIEPGQTFFGIVIIPTSSYEPLEFKFTD